MTLAPAELLIDRRGPLLRAAVVCDGRLTDFHVDHDRRAGPRTGSLWLGRVERLSTGLNAAFIDLGQGPPGLLGVADIRRAGAARPEPKTAVGTLLRGGQAVLVQVKAEAFGAKGPTLSMDVSLPGRFLVHVPFRRGVTVSRRFGQGAIRAALVRRLQALTVGDGWIARASAGVGADDVIAAESESLALVWRDVTRQATTVSAPIRLWAGPDAGCRAAIGQGAQPWARIVMATDPPWAEAFAAWCAEAAPDLAGSLERYREPAPLYDRYDLESQVQALLGRHAPLSGGAGLVIERTEAMTVIDVNAGERGNALAVNLEAVPEIARQVRLRNVGGIIVIDFITMTGRGDGERLLDALAAAVADDPAQTEVYGLSKLGLVEMTRARRGPTLADVLSAPGSGEDQ